LIAGLDPARYQRYGLTHHTHAGDEEVTVGRPEQLTELSGPLNARPMWEKPEMVVLTLEDVESAADVEVVFASSCSNSCDVD
jgi:hypothetical protein